MVNHKTKRIFMAGQKPSFITGASAKIKVGGRTFAYAADVSYQIAVDTIPVETMGRYEAVTNEPVNYSVAGELSVVRYTALAQANNMPGVASSTSGNGLGAVVDAVTQQKLSNHVNPVGILTSQTFDVEVFQKQQTATTPLVKIHDARFTRLSGGLNKRGILVERMSFVGVLISEDSMEAATSGDTDLS